MEIFLAGNFPALQSKQTERPIADFILNYGSEYKRLVSFFYLDEAKVALEVKKELMNGEEKPRLIKRRNKQTTEGLNEGERDSRKNGRRLKKTMLLDPRHKISGKGYLMGEESDADEETTYLDQQNKRD
jgi:hypothetical protein